MRNDINAAHTMPGSGNVSLLDDVVGQDTHGVFPDTSPTSTQLEGSHTLQRILVVEDDPTLATLEAGVLTAHGFTVVIVHNGELAVATLHTFVPDLVVLDLELLGSLSGWDVLQKIRSHTNIPVLFTTSSETTIRRYIRSFGEPKTTLDHLPKPYPMQTLLKRVQRMLTIVPYPDDQHSDDQRTSC